MCAYICMCQSKHSVGNRCQSQRTNVSRIEKETAGNSRGIRRVFRGNSDGKKGIPISRIKNIPRFAIVFYAEATPSSPFIIFKGEIDRKCRVKRRSTPWSRILCMRSGREPQRRKRDENVRGGEDSRGSKARYGRRRDEESR